MSFLIVDFVHYEMLYALLKALDGKVTEATICSDAAIINRLKDISFQNGLKVEWIAAAGPDELYNKKILSGAKFDYCILNTIYSHFDFMKLWLDSLEIGKTILTVHNVNYWFKMGTRYKIFKRPRSAEHQKMLSLLDKMNAVLVLSDSIKEFLLTRYKTRIPVVVFPYSIYEGAIQQSYNDEALSVAIPGIIEQRRKDYAFVLDVIERLSPQKITLKLLGRPKDEYGAGIIARCESLKAKGYNISYYTDYVEPEEFEKQIANADVILAPVILETSYAGIPEVYGKSKETGAVFDMIRYAKPGIYPAQLNAPKEINNSTLTYNSAEELYNCLNKIADKKVLENLKANAAIASQYYKIENVSKRFFESLATL